MYNRKRKAEKLYINKKLSSDSLHYLTIINSGVTVPKKLPHQTSPQRTPKVSQIVGKLFIYSYIVLTIPFCFVIVMWVRVWWSKLAAQLNLYNIVCLINWVCSSHLFLMMFWFVNQLSCSDFSYIGSYCPYV